MNRKQRRAKQKTTQRRQGKAKSAGPARFAAGQPMPMPEARRLLEGARAAVAAEKYFEAYQAYRRLFDSQYANPALLVEATVPLIRSDALSEAEAFSELGTQRFADSAIAWNQLGQAKLNVGRPEAALAAYQRALELDDTLAQAWAGISQVQERLHRLDDALVSIDRAIEVTPGKVFLSYCRGIVLRRLGRLDEALAQQRAVLDDTDDAKTQHLAWCEIASIYQRQDDPAAARDAYRAAKEVQAPLRSAHLAKFADFQRNAEARFVGFDAPTARAWYEQPLDPDSRGKGQQAFLIGHPRSGTTLTEQVLAAHPNAVTLDEREAFVQVESTILGLVPTVETLNAATIEQAQRFGQAYTKEAARYLNEPVGGRLLVDKRPDSVLLLPTILRMMPRSRVVVVIRDPRDVCASCYEQSFQLGVISAQFHSIESTCRYYAWFMSFWLRMREILPSAMWHEVRYEDLVENTESTARALIDFVGLPWEDGVLAFTEKAAKRVVSTPSYAAVAKPITGSAVGRWRAYADEFATQADTLAPYLEAFGYDES
ncbi:MAG: sulfotransferase [Phycisphaerales bacterium JB063]